MVMMMMTVMIMMMIIRPVISIETKKHRGERRATAAGHPTVHKKAHPRNGPLFRKSQKNYAEHLENTTLIGVFQDLPSRVSK